MHWEVSIALTDNQSLLINWTINLRMRVKLQHERIQQNMHIQTCELNAWFMYTKFICSSFTSIVITLSVILPQTLYWASTIHKLAFLPIFLSTANSMGSRSKAFVEVHLSIDLFCMVFCLFIITQQSCIE